MKIITKEEIDRVDIPYEEMLGWVEKALLIKKNCKLPKKISMKSENGMFFNVMPCVVPDLDIAGLKVVSRYPDRVPSLKSDVLLYDFKTGGEKVNALVDADFITTWRTVCVAMHSLNLLAKKDYKIISLIGLGEIGKSFLKVFIQSIGDKEIIIRLFDYKNSAQQVVDQYKKLKNVKFEIYNNYIDMAKDSDIVVSAVTYLEDDLADPQIYKPGVLIIPIHTRGFMQCDLVFDKIFCDDLGHICDFKNYNQYKNVHEISDLLAKKCKGRENKTERIIVYNVGIGLHDLVFANEIYKKLENQRENILGK